MRVIKDINAELMVMADGMSILGSEVEVSNEGLVRQVGGAIKDEVLLKPLRDVFKIGGWTGWDIRRVREGIEDMRDAMDNYLDVYIEKYDLAGKKVPYEALDSTTAWRDQMLTALFLVDDQRFKRLLKAVESSGPTPVFDETVLDSIDELFTAEQVRKIVKKEIKHYEDYKKFFSKACDNCLEIVNAAVNETTGRLPKAFFANHFVGMNGLVALAGQVRSSIRRAI